MSLPFYDIEILHPEKYVLYSNVITNIAFMIATLPIKLFVIINLLFKKYEKCRHIEEIKNSYIIFIISGVAASLEYASGIPVALVLLIRGLRISGGGPLK